MQNSVFENLFILFIIFFVFVLVVITITFVVGIIVIIFEQFKYLGAMRRVKAAIPGIAYGQIARVRVVRDDEPPRLAAVGIGPESIRIELVSGELWVIPFLEVSYFRLTERPEYTTVRRRRGTSSNRRWVDVRVKTDTLSPHFDLKPKSGSLIELRSEIQSSARLRGLLSHLPRQSPEELSQQVAAHELVTEASEGRPAEPMDYDGDLPPPLR